MRNFSRFWRGLGVVGALCSSVSMAVAEPVLITMNPWSEDTYQTHMDTLFGSGNWKLYNSYTDAAPDAGSIFSADTNFVYLQGSDGFETELNPFLAANSEAILNWVSAGGKLIIESGSQTAPGVSFGPADLVYPNFADAGRLTELALQVFNYFPIAATARVGSALAHNMVVALGEANLEVFITGGDTADDPNALVAGVRYGNGYIMYSGLTTENFHDALDGTALGDDAASWILNIMAYVLGLVTIEPISAQNTLTAATDIAGSARDYAAQLGMVLQQMTNQKVNATGKGKVAIRGDLVQRWVDEGDQTLASLTVGYGITDELTFGFQYQLGNDGSDITGLNVSSSPDYYGVFLSNRALSGLGLQWTVSLARGEGEVELTRSTALAFTEAGFGTTDVDSTLYQGEVAYGMNAAGGLVTPFARLTYVENKVDGYTETDAVTMPLTFNETKFSSTYLTLGSDYQRELMPTLNLLLNGGIEIALDDDNGTISGSSGIAGLETFSVAGDGYKEDVGGFISVGLGKRFGNGAQLTTQVAAAKNRYTGDTEMYATVGFRLDF